MNDFQRTMLVDIHRADLEREVEKARLAADFPSRPAARRTLLVMAVLLIGMLAWLVH